jgi:hypothetical protein
MDRTFLCSEVFPMQRPLMRAGAWLSALLVLAACNSRSEPVQPDPDPGDLQVRITGLPDSTYRGGFTVSDGVLTSPVYSGERLLQLPIGTLTVTPVRVTDVGIGYIAAAQSVTIRPLQRDSVILRYSIAIAPRTTTNRPDETTLSKVKLLYVLPSDGTDRGLDTNGTIHRTFSSGQRWLASQTRGRYLRADAADGALDITFVRLPRTDAVYLSFGAFIRDSLEKDLRAAGFTQANTLLLAYYDGRHVDRCASAAWPPALSGTLAALYLRGAPTSAAPCAGNAFAATAVAAPGYWEFVAVHEMFHLLGLVSTAAPDHTLAGHVGNDPTDLMYAGTLPWRPAVVDVSKSNYYNNDGLPNGVANLVSSPYVITPTR